MKTAINIEGGQSTPLRRQVVVVLEKALMRAIEQGREATAQVCAQELSKIGGVQGTTIRDCQFTSNGAARK